MRLSKQAGRRQGACSTVCRSFYRPEYQLTPISAWGHFAFFLRFHHASLAAPFTALPNTFDIIFQGTSKKCHRSSGGPIFLANDSALFSFRFCAVHLKEARDRQLQQFFEVPTNNICLDFVVHAEIVILPCSLLQPRMHSRILPTSSHGSPFFWQPRADRSPLRPFVFLRRLLVQSKRLQTCGLFANGENLSFIFGH